MQHICRIEPGERAELLPDGRYLVMNWDKVTRVVDIDGSTIEPSPKEAVALRSLLGMRLRRGTPCQTAGALDDYEEDDVQYA